MSGRVQLEEALFGAGRVLPGERVDRDGVTTIDLMVREILCTRVERDTALASEWNLRQALMEIRDAEGKSRAADYLLEFAAHLKGIANEALGDDLNAH